MCGILGIIHADRLTDGDAVAMRDTMAARGPDDATLLRRDDVLLAHRRLAIRDPEAGRQPWVSPDGNVALVYNGEIYNDDVLRDELQAHGHRFTTRCDTEVLMAAWLCWGPACIERLRGMFAIGVYDFRRKSLFLARDRFGIKPLFYAQIGEQFVFASSLAAIRRHPDFRAAPNLASLRHYLTTFRITLAGDTVYQSVQSLLPSQTLLRDEQALAINTYWHPPKFSTQPQASFDESVEQFQKTISHAVSIRLRSDVPVGMMLSGGVDSNLLACLLHENDGVSMTARCGGGVDGQRSPQAGDDPHSDFAYARRCAEHVGFDFDQVKLDQQQYHRTWLELIESYATPVSTPTDAIIYRVAQQLRQSVGVALGGEGADEACCGYLPPHWSGHDFDLSGSLSRLAGPAAQIARKNLLQAYGTDHFESRASHYLAANGLISAGSQAALFRQKHWPDAYAQGAVERYYEDQFDQWGDLPGVEKTARLLLQVNLESLLSRLDSATMAASLEARVPYTDHEFVEQMFRLPHRLHIDVAPSPENDLRTALQLVAAGALRNKRLLRAVASTRMPQSLAMRPKASFPTPLASWLHGPWRQWLSDLYRTSPFAQEYFNPDALAQVQQLPEHLAMWHWPIANVILWGDRWIDR